jgi:hypothetical protein
MNITKEHRQDYGRKSTETRMDMSMYKSMGKSMDNRKAR